MSARGLVVAFGNPLMGDDGVGPATLAALRHEKALSHVRLEDSGTDATALLRLWQGEPTVVLVDALTLGNRPGTVRVLLGEEIIKLNKTQPHLHALSLPACLEWVLLAEPGLSKVKLILVGVEPQFVGPQEGLSKSVRAAIPIAVKTVRSVFAEAE